MISRLLFLPTTVTFSRNGGRCVLTTVSCRRAYSASPPAIQAPSDPHLSGWRKNVLRFLGFYGEESQSVRVSSHIYSITRSHCFQESSDESRLSGYSALATYFSFPAIGSEAKLSPDLSKKDPVSKTFFSKFCLLSIHMWMLHVRLRREGNLGVLLGESLFDKFWVEMEREVLSIHGMRPFQATKYLKDLQCAFFAAAFSYDEALGLQDRANLVLFKEADRALAEALWRNVYGSSTLMGDTSMVGISRLVEYVRREISQLQSLPTEDLLSGKIIWNK